MSVISRINELLLANAHHAIDQAENPEVMLKQVIRDMDRNIYEARVAVVSAVAGENNSPPRPGTIDALRTTWNVARSRR